MLERYRMLDLARMLPGPFTSHLLADMGMDVIRVEEPQGRAGAGRDIFTPGNATPAEDIRAQAYNAAGRNKRSVALNLINPAKREAAQQVFYRLVENADVILDGYRPGTTKWLGVDYDTVRKINPRIVYCAITGYGQDGPYAQRGAHGGQFFAASGLMTDAGRGGPEPEGPSLAYGDIVGSLYAANAILAALHEREVSGEGQFIDVSITGAVMTLAEAKPQGKGIDAARGDRPVRAAFRRRGPGLGSLRCRDGKYVSLGNGETTFWERFCKVIDHPEFIPLRDTQDEAAYDAMIEAVRALFLTKDRDEWTDILAKADTVVAPVHMTLEEAYEDPQLQHIGMAWDLPHPTEGTVRQLGFPVRFSRTPVEFAKFAPLLGEHTREILAEAGYDEAAMDALEADSVIRSWTGD